MKVGYLEKILRDGLGTTSSKSSQFEVSSRPSMRAQLQQVIQNHYLSLGLLKDGIEDRDEGVAFDELFEVISPGAGHGKATDQTAEPGRNVQSDDYALKPRLKNGQTIMRADFGTQDSPPALRNNEDGNLTTTPELNMDTSDVKINRKKVRKYQDRSQETATRMHIEKPEMKHGQSREGNRAPLVEVVEKHAIGLPDLELKESEGEQQIKASPVQNRKSSEQKDETQTQKSRIRGLEKDEKRLPSDIGKQEKTDTSQSPAKVVEAKQTPKAQKISNPDSFIQLLGKRAMQTSAGTNPKGKSREQLQPLPRKAGMAEPHREQKQIPSDLAKQEEISKSVTHPEPVEVIEKPTRQHNLKTRFFSEPLTRDETQIAKITKEVELINNKLEEHIRKGHEKIDKPVFLRKRPPSSNLGGWSGLERNYIR